MNTDKMLPQTVKNKIMDEYDRKLIHSGYNMEERTHILEAGIIAYERRRERAKETSTNLHKTAQETKSSRTKKKTKMKYLWFIENKDSRKRPAKNYMRRPPVAAPIFIPRTPHGELIKRIRDVESNLKARLPLKVVEKCVQKLKEILHKSDPMGASMDALGKTA